MFPSFDTVAPLQALGPASPIATSHPADIQIVDLASRPAAPASAQDAAAFSRAVQASEPSAGATASIEAQAALPPSADSLSSRLAKQADALSRQLSSMQAGLNPTPQATPAAGGPAPTAFDKAETDGAVAQMEHAYMFAIETTLASRGSTESTKIFNTLLKGQ